MTTRLRLLQFCEQPFHDLDGDDFMRRRCRRCDVEVHNYDLLPQRAREELLRRSDRERTVCVGTAMPVAAAPGCRANPEEDGAQPFMRAIAVREAVVLAPQWWRELSLPTPTVIAAIADLAGDYGLRDHSLPDAAGWGLHDRERALSLVVRVQSRGDRTEVGVRVYPIEVAEAESGPPILEFGLLFGGLLALLALVRVVPLVAIPVVWVVVLGGAAVRAIVERRELAVLQSRTRALKEWGETWQHGFFTALEARLAPTQRYR